jgi:hypothetical protein
VDVPIARQTRCRPRSAALVVAVVLLAGCGGGSHAKTIATHVKPSTSPRPSQTQTEATPAPKTFAADPKLVAVVRHWVDTLRAGHTAAAARYFAIPAIVQNAGPAYRLKSRKAVRFFNESLPCGARVVRALAGDKYTIVIFRLTERVGSAQGCGTAAGHLAATAFRFKHGLISEWIRVQPPAGQAAEDSGPAS